MTETISDLIGNRFAQKTDTGKDRPAEGTHAQQLRHRSRRRYKDTPVPQEVLDILYACALSAPAKSDLQQVSIIQFDDADLREKVTDLIPSMPWIKQAPVFLLFCGDGRRVRRVCEMRGTDFAHEPLDAFMNAAADAAIVMMNFIVAAEAEGLGCCPISAVREVTDEIAELAGLPEGVFPFAGLCVGHPADDPAISVRLPISLTVHRNKYDDSRLATEIDSYDTRRAQTNPYSKQREPDRFGSKQNYGWSDDKARQTANRERADFSTYIRRNGFDI
ncbi:MAG: nitroreductase family protein [Rhodospirillales bacterium]|nr:nitroreductase family protein [Rhodospirillales bacterium]MBO6785790.1 nitroreductase family protein [Rhodospirillales bacterium]